MTWSSSSTSSLQRSQNIKDCARIPLWWRPDLQGRQSKISFHIKYLTLMGTASCQIQWYDCWCGGESGEWITERISEAETLVVPELPQQRTSGQGWIGIGILLMNCIISSPKQDAKAWSFHWRPVVMKSDTLAKGRLLSTLIKVGKWDKGTVVIRGS